MNLIDIIVNYYPAFLNGALVTIKMCLVIWISGILIGFPLGWLSSRYKDFGNTIWYISFLLGSIPSLVFLMWLHYPAQEIFSVVIDPFYTATLTLAVINIFSISEIVRSALQDFPQQYCIVGKISGLSNKEIALKIQFPILIRATLPSLINLQVIMLHTTLFASLISVEELFRVVQTVNSKIYKPIELYTLLAIIFVIVCAPINYLAIHLKNKFKNYISEK